MPETSYMLNIGESALYGLAAMFDEMSVYDMEPGVEAFAEQVKGLRDRERERAIQRLEAGLDP
jgi:hypothetical protein